MFNLNLIPEKLFNPDTVDEKARFIRLAYPEVSEWPDERLVRIYDNLIGEIRKVCRPDTPISPSGMRLFYCPVFSMPITNGPFADKSGITAMK
nr:hypothetical protein [uncultured Arsenicibacter sp.]